MSDLVHSKASAVRAPVASPSTPALSLSPIVQLQPTGYRDIQPFQRGQGWHSNGKATAKLRRARETSERVVFPVIPTHHAGVGIATASSSTSAGPSASAVSGYDSSKGSIEDTDDNREREEAEIKRAMSPSISAIPVPPPQRPQRPSSGSQVGNQRSSSSGSFRTRALVSTSTAAVQSNTKSRAMATSTNSSRRSVDGMDDDEAGDQDDELPPPDPATMEKLLQEYNERTRHPTKTVDHDTYHRKMQHRYNESKALRERIARLEMELDDLRQERDEALETAQQHEQRLRRASLARKSVKDTDDLENQTTSSVDFVAGDSSLDESASATRPGIPDRNLAAVAARVSHKLHQHHLGTFVTSTEEVSHREKCFKLERTLATAKEGLAQMQAKLLAMHEADRETIETLRAQLQLEQQASKLLSVQVRETNAAFRSTADELVTTQVALEKVQIEKQIVVEQIQAETKQLLSDHKRKELQSRVKSVVRTLGKEALHQKMEALHTRVLTAEHHMRAAQLEAARLQCERDQQQQQLDAILSSRAIKYHGLASRDGGIPGILQRAASLYHGTRTINGLFMMVQMLYEDNRGAVESVIHAATQRSNQDDELPSEPDDGYAIHILVYEAFTAQDDYITFHLRDIQRLVPDAEKYLARCKDRRHDRFLELAELLLQQCHIGYKNGHIVLTEMATNRIDMGESDRREMPIYRGTRYLRSRVGEEEERHRDDELLVDVVVSEVYNPSVSQLWWLEIQAMRVEQDTDSDGNQCAAHEIRITIDSQQLRAIVSTFASYRPSESMQSRHVTVDTQSAFGIHEDLLEPLFERMEWRHTSSTTCTGCCDGSTERGSPYLVLVGEDGNAIATSKVGAVDEKQSSDLENEDSTQEKSGGVVQSDHAADFNSKTVAAAASTQRVLDHRSVVRHGDLFYCVRIQEIWDGELMLRVTMEEPEDNTHRYEAALLEKEIACMAEFLYRSGCCDENYAALIKYGLPAPLHDPMCKLLKKHARPGSTSSSGGNEAATAAATVSIKRISIESLLHEIRPPEARSQQQEMTRGRSSESVLAQLIQLPSAFIVGHRLVDHVRIVGMATDTADVQFIQDVLMQFQTLREDRVATKQRIGCRRIGESCSSSFVVATGYSGFVAPFTDIVVIDVCSLAVVQHPSSSKQATSELVISRVSMRQALATIGFRVPVLEP